MGCYTRAVAPFRAMARSLLGKPSVVLLLLTLFFGLWLCTLKGPVSLDDGLRHVEMGRRMAEQGTITLDWSQFIYAGVLRDLHTDPWFLADALYAPFAHIDSFIALRLFTLVAFVLLAASFLLALRAYEVPKRSQSILLLLLALGDPVFLFRLLLGRPFVLFTAAALLVLWCLRARREWVLVPLLCLSVLLSHLFIFPLGIALLFAVWLGFGRGEWKRTGLVLLFSGTGVGAGLLLHPGAGAYLWYIVHVLALIPLLGSLGLGSELQTSFFVDTVSVWVLLGAIITLLGACTAEERKRAFAAEGDAPFLLILLALFLGAFFFWDRAIDFLWPLLLLFIGIFLTRFPALPSRIAKRSLPASVYVRGLVLVSLLLLAAPAAFELATIPLVMPRLSAASLERVPHGARVLNIDWGLMPLLVHLRSDLKFAAGMDPTFTYLADPGMTSWMRGADVVSPKNVALWLRSVPAAFSSDTLVFNPKKHQNLAKALTTVSGVVSLGSSPQFLVYRLPPALLPFPPIPRPLSPEGRKGRASAE